MTHAFVVASSTLWAVTYLLILRRGFLDKASGVPLPALAFAITWEFLFPVLDPTPTLPRAVTPTWFALDTCILYQALTYRRGNNRSPRCIAVALLGAFAINGALVIAIDDRDGVTSGFAVNAVMSVAFLAAALRRRDVRGQSMGIAIAKLMGSAIALPPASRLHGEVWALRLFMATTVVADVLYAAVLSRRLRSGGLNPWTRV